MAKIPQYHQDQLASSLGFIPQMDSSGAALAQSVLGNANALSESLQSTNQQIGNETGHLINQAVGQFVQQRNYDRQQLNIQKAHEAAAAKTITEATSRGAGIAAAQQDQLKSQEAMFDAQTLNPIVGDVRTGDTQLTRFQKEHQKIQEAGAAQFVKDPIAAGAYNSHMNQIGTTFGMHINEGGFAARIEQQKTDSQIADSAEVSQAIKTNGDPASLKTLFAASRMPDNQQLKSQVYGPAYKTKQLEHETNMMFAGLQTGIEKSNNFDQSVKDANGDRVAAAGNRQAALETMKQRISDPMFEAAFHGQKRSDQLLQLKTRLDGFIEANTKEQSQALDAENTSAMAVHTANMSDALGYIRNNNPSAAQSYKQVIQTDLDEAKKKLYTAPANAQQIEDNGRLGKYITHLEGNISSIDAAEHRYEEGVKATTKEAKAALEAKDKAFFGGEAASILRENLRAAQLQLPKQQNLTGSPNDFASIEAYNNALDKASSAGALGFGVAAQRQYSAHAATVDAYKTAANKLATKARKPEDAMWDHAMAPLYNLVAKHDEIVGDIDPNTRKALNPTNARKMDANIDDFWSKAVTSQVAMWQQKNGRSPSVNDVKGIKAKMLDQFKVEFQQEFGITPTRHTAIPPHHFVEPPEAVPVGVGGKPVLVGDNGKPKGNVEIPPPPPYTKGIVE